MNTIDLEGFESESLLTIDELAALLKVPKSWIYLHTRSRAKARLPVIKLGKYLRFSEVEVRSYLCQLRQRSRSSARHP